MILFPMSLYRELAGAGFHEHTCKCDKCHKSQFKKGSIPQRKKLCPVDKHFKDMNKK